jgi:ankyrin repeat protein
MPPLSSDHTFHFTTRILSPQGARSSSPDVNFAVHDAYDMTFTYWDPTRPLSVGSPFNESTPNIISPLYNHKMLDFTTSMAPVIRKMLPMVRSLFRIDRFSLITISELSIQKQYSPGAMQLLHKEPLDFQFLHYVLHRLVNDDSATEALGDPQTNVDKLFQASLQHIFTLESRLVNGLIDSVPSHLKIALEQALFCAALEMNASSTLEAIIDRGFDPNRTLRFGHQWLCPLERSCRKRHLKATKILLEHDADPNKHVSHHVLNVVFGLHKRRPERHPDDTEIFRLLLTYGARVTQDDMLLLILRCNTTELSVLMETFAAESFEKFIAGGELAQIFRHIHWEDDLLPMMKKIVKQGYPHVGFNESIWNRTMTNSLSCAAATNRTGAIELLLEAGAIPNDVCLISAVLSGRLEVFECFLDLELDPNAVVSYNDSHRPVEPTKDYFVDHVNFSPNPLRDATALSESIRHEFREATRIMIQRGHLSQSTSSNLSFWLALNAACYVGNGPIVQQLLSFQNHRCHYGFYENVITTAIDAGQNTIVLELLHAGISPDATSLLAAVKQKDLELTELLRKLVEFHPRQDRSAFNILIAAIKWGNFDLVKSLLQARIPLGQLIHVTSDDDQRWGLTSCIDPDHKMDLSISLLGIAVLEGNHEVIELLFGLGGILFWPHPFSPPPPGKYEFIVTPLTACVIKDDIDLLRSLLIRGLDPCDNEAIYVATVLHRVEAMTVLLGAFAQKYPQGTKHYRSEALVWAIQKDDLPMLKLLASITDPLAMVSRVDTASKGYSIVTRFCALAEATRLDCERSGGSKAFSLLLPHVKNLDTIIYDRPSSIHTPLTYAITMGSLPIFRILVQHGANIMLQPQWGCSRTPLQAAAEMGNSEMVKFLLDARVNPNEMPAPQRGRTALQLAATKGHVEIATTLLENGADVNAAPAQFHGRTAFECATEHGRFDMMLLLVNHGADLLSNDQRQFKRATQFAEKDGQYGASAFANELLQSVLRMESSVPTGAEENYPVGTILDDFDDFLSQL